MTMTRNMPTLVSQGDLVAVLEEILEGVKSGDTMEGSIEFLIPVPDPCPDCGGAGKQSDYDRGTKSLAHSDKMAAKVHPCLGKCGGTGRVWPNGVEPSPDSFEVHASYRIGNLMGQGGLRMIGEMREVPYGPEDWWRVARRVASAQAKDEALWSPSTAVEGYYAQELRALHAAIEGDANARAAAEDA